MSTGFRVWPKSRRQTRAHPRRYQVRVRPRRRRDDPPDRRDQHPGLLQVLAEGLVRGEARRRAGARHDRQRVSQTLVRREVRLFFIYFPPILIYILAEMIFKNLVAKSDSPFLLKSSIHP